MLITFVEEKPVKSFSQLYFETLYLLAPYRMRRKTAVIFGPISDPDPLVVEKNITVLRERALMLASSGQGWNVFDITSCHRIIQRIVSERGFSKYPIDVVEDFTLPLIRNECFHHIQFRTPFTHSVGTTAEYEEVQRCRRYQKIEVINFTT